MARTAFLDLGPRCAQALLAGALLAGLPASAAGAAAPAAPATWSQPTALSTCPADDAPLVVFPSDSPTHATGPGAILWSRTRECPGGAALQVAALSNGDVPHPPATPHSPDDRALRLDGPLAATGGPYGRIALVGSSPAPPAPVSKAGTAPAQGELTEGAALGPFSPPTATAGPSTPSALATAYLGDVALASPSYAHDEEGGVQLRVERHHAHAFAPPIAVSHGRGGRVEALGLALDYRSDALVVWRRHGSIYARDLPASGRTLPTVQRLAPAIGPPTAIATLLSDDNRGIVAWSQQSAGETSVYVDLSATGVSFGAPRLLERFADPGSLPPPPQAAPRLVRLSSESVMLAWTGSEEDHWAVRAAAIDLDGIGPANTISAAGSDALLADLAPGPDGEALALWTEPQRDPDGRPDFSRQAIFAARGIDAYPARTIFGRPEPVAAPGPNSDATVAFDPDSDRALAAWLGEGGAVDYAIRTPPVP